MPVCFISLLNSVILIRPKTKKSTINACCDCKANTNKETYNNPENALTTNSFTWWIYKSSNSSKYKFFELLP